MSSDQNPLSIEHEYNASPKERLYASDENKCAFDVVFAATGARPSRPSLQRALARPPARTQLLLDLHQATLHPHSEGRVSSDSRAVEHLGEGALDALVDVAEPALLGRDLIECVLVDNRGECAGAVDLRLVQPTAAAAVIPSRARVSTLAAAGVAS